jgi:hypothetical protein
MRQIELELADSVYVCAEAAGEVVGCAEMRRGRSTLFLNHIAVSPDARGCGAGGELLAYAIRGVASPLHDTIQLDVLDRNTAARAWYVALGFVPCGEYQISEFCPQAAAEGEGYAAGVPQADAAHKVFGFSQFTVTTPLGTYQVGRLGGEWFRVTAPNALRDGGLLATLRRLDPRRRILAVLMNAGGDSALRAFARGTRMSAALGGVVSKLAGRTGQASQSQNLSMPARNGVVGS